MNSSPTFVRLPQADSSTQGSDNMNRLSKIHPKTHNMKKSELIWMFFLGLTLASVVLGVALEIDLLFWASILSMILAWSLLTAKGEGPDEPSGPSTHP